MRARSFLKLLAGVGKQFVEAYTGGPGGLNDISACLLELVIFVPWPGLGEKLSLR